MIRRVINACGILVIAVLATVWCVAQEPVEEKTEVKADSPAIDIHPAPLSAEAEGTIEELAQIRARLKSEFDPLKDTIFSTLNQKTVSNDTDESQQTNDFRTAMRDIVIATENEKKPSKLLSKPIESPDRLDQELIWSLRQSGRLLDQKANDLEEIELYQEADDLRHLASQLRHQARRTSSGSH